MDDQQANPVPPTNLNEPQAYQQPQQQAGSQDQTPGVVSPDANVHQAPGSGVVAGAPPQNYDPPAGAVMPAGQQALPSVDGRHNGRLGLIIAIIAVCLVGAGVALFIFLKPSNTHAPTGNSSQGVANSTSSLATTLKEQGATNVQTAAAGHPLSLTGSSGEKFSVTVQKLVYHASPYTSNADNQPAAGNQLMEVWMSIKNNGTTALKQPDAEAVVMYSSSNKAYTEAYKSTTTCPNDSVIKTIRPGATARGCDTFEVPANAKIANVTFTPDFDQASDVGIWSM
jgi:hypothetical protein